MSKLFNAIGSLDYLITKRIYLSFSLYFILVISVIWFIYLFNTFSFGLLGELLIPRKDQTTKDITHEYALQGEGDEMMIGREKKEEADDHEINE